MKAVTKNWLSFAMIAALTGACGDGGGASNDGVSTTGGDGSTTGTANAGANATGGGGQTTGGGDTTGGGQTAGASNTNGGTDADGGGAGGGGATGASNLPPPSACGYQTNGPNDTSAMGGCYYFYCYQTEETLRAAATTGACANDKDVAIQCEGQSVRTVADCARQNTAVILQGDAKFKEAVTACARKEAKLAGFSDGCLACNVNSASCAAKSCFGACATGDSAACDECRQTNNCTPAFYQCAGLPDPMM